MCSMSDKALEWISRNMTNNVVDKLANTIFEVIQTIFTSPFTIAINLVEIIQNKKYKKFIVVIWGIEGVSVLIISLVLWLINNTYPFNAWGLGVAISSLLIILLYKNDISIKVSSDLSREIESEVISINRNKILDEELIADELMDEDTELIDEDKEELIDEDEEELIDDDDDELIDDEDDLDNYFSSDDIDSILSDVNNLLDSDEIDLDFNPYGNTDDDFI